MLVFLPSAEPGACSVQSLRFSHTPVILCVGLAAAACTQHRQVCPNPLNLVATILICMLLNPKLSSTLSHDLSAPHSHPPTHTALQFNEQSPTMPPNKPPSGNSMAYGARNAMHGPGPHNGYSGQQFQPQPGGRMEPPTPCGMYNLLEQPDSNQDSPTEIAMSCGGSPSSKLMPPPDAAATVRLLAAQAQAAASAALDQQAGAAAAAAAAVAAGGAGSLELLNTLLRGGDASSSMVGDWASSRQQQQGQDAGPGWAPLTMFQQQQQQQYIQQQMAMQQQQMYQQQQMQQRYQSQQGGNFFVPVSGPGRPTSVDIPYTAGGALRYGPLPGQQRPPSPQDAFDAVQRGLAPLRMGKQFAGDLEGSQSAPACMTNVFGAPSQWIQFAQDAANAVAGNPAGMRASSDAGAYEGQVYSSYAPSPSSCAMQSSGNGSTPAGGVAAGAQNAAQALMMARGCGSLSHSPSPSPTASLAQRMTVLGMNSPAASPMHPSAMGEPRSTQQQQQGEWGPGSNRGCVPSQDAAAAGSYQQQQAQDNAQRQHNQGGYMPQTDDLVSDPISEMLMEKPLEQLADDRRGNSTADSTHRHISIMEATLHQQQNTEPTAAAAGCSRSSQGGGASTPTWQQQPQGPPAAPEEMSDLLSLIPPPPKTGNDADKAAWQAQVRHVLSTLKPHQRQELARLSEKQWMTIMAASSAGSASTQDSAPQQNASSSKSCTPSPVLPSSSSAPAPSAALPPASAAQAASYAPNNGSSGSSFGRGFGGKQRLGPSRLSASSPALDTSSAEDVAAAAAWLGEECPAAANGPPGSTAMQQQQPLPAGSNAPGAAASAGFASQGMSCYQAEAAACGQMLPLPQQQQQQGLSAPKPALSNGSTPFAAAGVKREGSQEPSAAAGAVPGSLMAELREADSTRCPSPLKRRQPSSGVFSSAAEQCAGSPLKRACVSDPFGGPETQQGQQPRGRQQLPEPPSFATLMQAEGGEDDAIAWATAAASDSLKRAAGSCVSLGVVSGGLTTLDSFPSSFLRLGSLQGGDSMQMLNTLPDVAAADNGSSPQGGELAGDRAGQAAGVAAAEGGEAGRKE